MNTELLKKKILQLAMQGKLVEQDERDGTADELIEKILDEKKKMMNEGKIKKEKLSRIYKNPTDNHYYEKFYDGKEKIVKPSLYLPDGWQYIKMNDVVFYEQPSKYIVESTEYDNKYEIPVLTPGKSFVLGYTNEANGIFTNVPTIIFDDFTTESKYVDFKFKVKSSAMKILNCSTLVNIKFMYYLLQIINVDTTTHKRHWLSNYEYMVIPIPSKKMQDKIVEKIDNLFTKVQEIDIHHNKIGKLHIVLKSKIIDLAIKGKITKPLPTDEPSSKLIEKIMDEKHRLMKEGKIKKENLSIIYKGTDNQFYEKFDDGKIINVTKEIPYSIPQNWSWIRLKTICTKIVDGDHNPPPAKPNKTDFIMLSARNIQNDKLVNIEDARYLSQIDFELGKKRINLQKDDILLTIVGTLGRSCIYNDNRNILFQRSVAALTVLINNRFLKLVFDSNYIQNKMNQEAKGTAQRGFYLKQLENILIPVAPLEEQIRIIDKKNNIFKYIETAE